MAIERLAAGAGTIFKVPETIDEKWQALERAFQRRIKKEASAVEFEPDMIPAVLVAKPLDEDDRKLAEMDMLVIQTGLSRSASIRQMLERMAKTKRAAEQDTVLHLNTKNTLMQRLREMPQDQIFDLAITCIYNNALMFSQHYISPENAEIIFSDNNKAFSAMIATAQELTREQELRAKVEIERDQLQRRLPPIALTEYRSCFFAFDYKVEDNFRILKWLQDYFGQKRFGVRVLAPAHQMEDLNILRDLHQQLKTAHFGIADVSNNLNVLYEAGLIHGMGKPLILLQEKNSKDAVPFDIFSDFRVKYEVSRHEANVKFTWLEEGLDKAMKAVFRMRPELEKTPKRTD